MFNPKSKDQNKFQAWIDHYRKKFQNPEDLQRLKTAYFSLEKIITQELNQNNLNMFYNYTLDSKTRDFLIDYFKSQTALGYDTNDDYLMNNEFMAYIMQQGVNSVVNYWVTHAKWNSVQTYTKELADYIIKTNARGFEDAAIMLNDFVFDKYGIICGNIALVRQ